MKKQHSSVDGFIPRRSTDKLGGLHNVSAQRASIDMSEDKLLHTTGSDNVRLLGQQTGNDLGRVDIDESLNIIDSTNEPTKKLSRKQRRIMANQIERPRSLARRIIKWAVIVIIVVVFAAGGYLAYKFISAGHNIFQGNIFDIFSNQALKKDSSGRSNFLILGTSEDDPGHEGPSLTDSILVVSVDQVKKDIYMFSVPRDLYVKYGRACPEGYSGKINSYFSCINDGLTNTDEQARLTATQKLVGNIFGLDIQYGAHVNHTVIKEAVDAVGGIDVNIQGSNGDSGVLDRNADWRCNYKCYYVKYNNGVHHLDGEHALYLSMARGDMAPTYGLGNSNFDREKNQQKILIALKDKAMSTGSLTNLSAVTKLVDTLGDNLRTDVQTNEIRTIIQLASEIKSGDVHTISLINNDGNNLVTTGTYGGASAVVPAAGVYEYDGIQAFIKKSLINDPVVREAAPVVVLNGTGTSGLGQVKADELTGKGFNVVLVDNAPEGTYSKTEIYQIGGDNKATADKLSSLFNVTIKKTAPPLPVNGNVRFVIIVGSTAKS